MIKIKETNGREIEYKFFLFPGGEVGFKLLNPKSLLLRSVFSVKILARINNSNDLILLTMAVNALREVKKALPYFRIDLILPYVPYSRQDRVCDEGEAFSLKVFTDIINSLNFSTVKILDPHSVVTPALINNCLIVDQVKIIGLFEDFKKRVLGSNCVFVSPDAGANKKTSELAKYFDHKEFLRADKLRDLTNGEIKETIVYADDLTGIDVIIADDICDGGRTFIELAKVLKAKNANKVILYVTHGIFSKGFDCLFENGIDEIYTTNSFHEKFLGYYPMPPKLNIFDIETDWL